MTCLRLCFYCLTKQSLIFFKKLIHMIARVIGFSNKLTKHLNMLLFYGI